MNSHRVITVISMLALAGLIVLRITGPSDLYHQTQPRTVSYTTDIIVNGNWLLPIERGEVRATKPPLYNWLAVPFVQVFGFSSEVAHKMPSLLALVGLWLMVILCGRRVMTQGPVSQKRSGEYSLGWLAAMMTIVNYTMFKLGYLARPDMLLTLFLFAGWWSGTELLLRSTAAGTNTTGHGDDRGPLPAPLARLRLLFWGSIALAWLTKGPVALLPFVYVVLASRLVAGRWRAMHATACWWGLPFSLFPFAAWIGAAYLTDRQHVVDVLWYSEVWGRITGQGPEGTREGGSLLLSLSYMPAYFFARFAPWCLLVVPACWILWRDRGKHNTSPTTEPSRWMIGALVWIVVVIVMFSLPAGKRADYIASAFPVAALLASWWWLERSSLPTVARVGLPAALAGLTLCAMTWVDRDEPQAPAPGFGDSIHQFLLEVRDTVATDDRPLVFWRVGAGQTQAILGASIDDSTASLQQALREHERLYILAVIPEEARRQLPNLGLIRRSGARVQLVLESDSLPRVEVWPGQLGLYTVDQEQPE